MTHFAHAVREELWSRGRRLESRLSHGEAFEQAGGIVATDKRDDALVALAEQHLLRLRELMPHDALVRLVAEAGTEGVSSTMTVRVDGHSVVTDPDHAPDDVELLRTVAHRGAAEQLERGGPPGSARNDVPILWLNGSGSVLLHEAAGHPIEHGLPALDVPRWLHVEVALRSRRASFRDVPLQRMQHVRVTQTDAPFELPENRIEVYLVEGGAYDPLTDVVTVRISASSAGAFELRRPRRDIRFLGAAGEPRRYPGVVCSREGQELVVASYAATLLTA